MKKIVVTGEGEAGRAVVQIARTRMAVLSVDLVPSREPVPPAQGHITIWDRRLKYFRAQMRLCIWRDSCAGHQPEVVQCDVASTSSSRLRGVESETGRWASSRTPGAPRTRD
jgi:hypothetical protein